MLPLCCHFQGSRCRSSWVSILRNDGACKCPDGVDSLVRLARRTCVSRRDNLAVRESQSLIMNNSAELRRLADSISNLATSITQITEAKVRAACYKAAPVQPVQSSLSSLPPSAVELATDDPIATKRQLTAHFRISMRTGCALTKSVISKQNAG